MRERIESSSSRTVMVHQLPLERASLPRAASGTPPSFQPGPPVMRTAERNMARRIRSARAISSTRDPREGATQ